MKKHLKLVVALALALTLCVSAFTALAAYQGTMYVNAKKVNVYKEDNKDSKVIKKLKGGQEIYVDDISPNGKWAQLLIEDTKHGGQMLGFVQTKYLSESIPQDFCKHKWSKWKTKTEPTCTEKGKKTRTCSICGKKETEKIKATGHSWGKWKVTKEATCAKKGERTRKCSVCGKKETEEYYDEHTYGAWTMTKDPTCTETGARERTCRVCGHVSTQTLDKLPHEYEYKITTEATDHSAGVRAKVCVNCGYTTGEESFDPEGTVRRGDRSEEVYNIQQLLVEQGYLNAGGADGVFGGGTEKALMKYQQDRNLNPDGIAWPQTIEDLQHDYGPWEIVKPMTRAEAGERVRVCQGCGFEQHETIEAAGTVLEKGARGETVRALQQIIKEVGYDAGGFDGIYGGKLDNALAGFAADNGMVVETGKIRPADVDAVVNAWFDKISAESWKGEGSLDTPVNLALTVEPAGEADDTGITTYNWTLTNLGSEKANYTALLLTFGDDQDFKHDNLVMQLDGVELKANAGNSASGSFNVDAEWGEGSLNFAALAVSDATGDKWLSNTVSFDNDVNPAEKTIAPVAEAIDVNALADGIYPVSFDKGDVLGGASGIFMNAVHIYTQDHYDLVDVSGLKVGDTIVVEGEEVPVITLEETEYGISVNEDQDARAFYLTTEEDSNGYTLHGLDDLTTFTEHGVTALVLDPAATFTDAWDIESEPTTTTGAEIVTAMQTTANDYFVPYNTTVRIENGKVVEINRVYVP